MTAEQEEDLYQIQVRLFRLFQLNENISMAECSKIFKKYDVYSYIETCYEIYHMQGDEANLTDIKNYLNAQGYKNEIKK